ncbi:MAG: DUF3201 domain-containing protein [Candidatus Heimdallarchaeota archaeon]|nr:DUF3201 domain-containing protein [Candidatus Heimdallarchaeota archaeon]
MEDLRKFLDMNKDKIHDLLNHMWQTIEQIALRFENDIPDIDLDNSHGNFIELADGWSESFYANPTATFPYGEIGYSLDGLYCVLAIEAKKLDQNYLAKLIELSLESDELKIEIYGGDDCFTTFFNSKEQNDFDEVLKAISKSKEDVLQIDLNIPAVSEEDDKELLLSQFIKLYKFLEDKKSLAKLPTYLTSEEKEE